MKRLIVVIAAAVLLCVVAAGVWRLLKSDRVVMLVDDGDARWIRADERFSVASKQNICTAVTFTTAVQIPAGVCDCQLQVMALRHITIDLDDRTIFDSGLIDRHWKTIHLVSIPTSISPGPHQLRCRVGNENGPSLMRLKGAGLGINSNANWLASTDGGILKPALPAAQIWEPRVDDHYLPTRWEMIWQLPVLALFFAVGLLIASPRDRAGPMVWPLRFRWMLLGAWLLLGMNNIFKVSRFSGYDLDGHYQYIAYVAAHLSLPRPDAGWQTFQSPLYYIFSAMLSRLLTATGATESSLQMLLRMIPLVCGAAMVEIGYRAGCMVFPNRGDMQVITTAFAALAPVNLYMAQTVSNEPMGAVASGFLLLIILRLLIDPQKVRSKRWLAMAGLALATAFLSKINTVLWAVPLAVAMAIALRRTRSNAMNWITAGSIVAGTAIISSGWLIIRNLRLIGKPFYLQSSVAGQIWWQDPGYRVPANFYEFGHVFSRPVYNVTASVWDSIYGTLWAAGIPSGPIPWNMGLMWHGLWLALIPTVLIFAGMIRAIIEKNAEPTRNCLRVSLLAVVCFAAAIVYVFLTLPVFSCGKASYMLGAMPCLGLLAAFGYDWIPKKRRWRAIAGGGLFCWGITAYLTYFVMGA